MRSRAKASSAIAALTCGLLLCLGASPALASKGVVDFFGGTGSLGGQFSNPGGAAVSQTGAGGATAGDVYVVDRGNQRVQQLSSTGKFIRAFGVDTIAEKGNDVQAVTIAGATGGTFTLTFNGQTTAPLSFDASAESVQSALESLALVGAFNVFVSGSGSEGNPYLVTFSEALGAADQPQMSAKASALTPSGATATVKTIANGFSSAPNDKGTGFEICDTTEGNLPEQCKAGTSSAIAGGFNNPQGIAIDQITGNLFVTVSGNRRIDVFSAKGVFEGAFGWAVDTGAAKFEFCTTASSCAAGSTGAGAGQFAAVLGYPAIAPTGAPDAGNLIVPSSSNNRFDEFSFTLNGSNEVTAATFVRGVGWDVITGAPTTLETCTTLSGCKAGAFGGGAGQFSSNGLTRVGVDTTGAIYALNNPIVPNCAAITRCAVQKFDPTATTVTDFAPSLLTFTSGAKGPQAATDIAIDPTNNHLYAVKGVAQGAGTPPAGQEQRRVLEFNSSAALLDTHIASADSNAATINAVNGLAATPSGGNLFLTTSSGSGGRPGAFILGSPLVPPVVSIEAVTSIGASTATFKGHVKTDGISAGYHFEYSTDGSNWTRVPTFDLSLPGDNQDHAVSLEVKGLADLTDYQVRLVASKGYEGGTATTTPVGFKTGAGPVEILSTSHAPHDTTALLKATILPHNQATKYQFEYADKASFEAEGFFDATHAPIPAATISGAGAVEVQQPIEGLQPGGTYFYRLTAFNATGSAQSAAKSFTTYTLEHSFGLCPNEEFRAEQPSDRLPDCRAYEQASPVDKNGNNLTGQVLTTHASIGGDAITFEAPGGVPGGEGAQNVPIFMASRGEENWSTQGLFPNASAGDVGQVHGWTPDFAHVFDSAGKTETGGVSSAFLSRSSADGSLETIVDYTPKTNYIFVGPSADGSRAFFVSDDPIGLPPGQPAPAPGKNNLYAWDRETGLSLAGVLPDDSVPTEGTIGGRKEGSGGNYNQDQHVVSSDGDAVYFTDLGTGQLYLRQDPTEPSAQTIHVSASKRTVPDPGGPLPATFQAATPDGSAAFFTSSEELTDDAHTIPTDAISRANLDGSESKGIFVPADADDVAVDGAHLYWTDTAAGTIGRADLDGSDPDPDFIAAAGKPVGIAVSGSRIYWTNIAGGTGDGEGTIGRASLDGTTEVNAEFIKGASNPGGIAVDGTYLYWANAFGGGNTVVGVARATLDGTTEVNEKFIEDFIAEDVAVNSTHIFVARGHDGNIRRVSLDGTTETKFLPPTGARAIAADANHMYWTDTDTDALNRANLDGGEVEVIDSAADSHGLALDSSHLYWTNRPSSRGSDLYRYDATSDQLTDFSLDSSDPSGAGVVGVLGASDDGSYVYFVANGVLDGVTNSPNGEGESARPGNCESDLKTAKDFETTTGVCNLYVAHNEGSEVEVAFIARLDTSGGATGSDITNWVPGSVFVGGIVQKTARVTPDGSTLLFRSRRQLTSYDNQFKCGIIVDNQELQVCPQFYRYRVGDPAPTCVSCNPTGAPQTAPGRPTLGSIEPPVLRALSPAPVLSRNLSADGNRVFFESRDALVASDTNGDTGCLKVGTTVQAYRTCQDAYMWEAEGTGSCHSDEQNGGCIYLLSTGKSDFPSFFFDASASGDDAFIFTSSQLVPQDQDELTDVYDVSVEGGLSSQNEIPPVPCEGEGCKAGAKEPAAQESAGSASFSGPPSAISDRKPQGCPKGKRKVRAKGKVRCVPRHKRHQRKANKTRRASR